LIFEEPRLRSDFNFIANPGELSMKRISPSTLVLLLAALLVVSAPSWAHHGTTAYDPSKTLKLKGTVMEFKWVNPHASLAWDVTAENGGVERWIVELTSPGMLTRSGWHHDSLKPGDMVTVYFHPAKSGTKWGIFQRVVFDDGRPALIDPRQP
jgi:hypothetical protein